MKVKLIALVIAGLFAQSASADENFMWGGSAEVGYRGMNIDGANRNGAYGNTDPALRHQPADAVQGTDRRGEGAGVPGSSTARRSASSTSAAAIGTNYLRAFGEEFGRDDQFINITGGGFGVWKASIYNNDIPHNYSFNALSPLSSRTAALQQVGPGGTYPNAQNPANWGSFNYSTQRNTWGGNAEFSNKSPWFIRADYNEVRTNGVKPSSGQLGTGSGNGLIEFGAPVDYKTQNTTVEGGYNSKQYGFKIAYLDSKFTDANEPVPVDELLPAERPRHDRCCRLTTTLKKWSINGYIKQLPWDSAIIARFTQSKLDEQLRHRRRGPQADG